jgi:transposase-like protein
MNKPASTSIIAQRESAWRDRLSRHACSDKTVAAFCRDEAVSTATFYGWRARLRARDGASRPATAPFIDLGTMPDTGVGGSTSFAAATTTGIDVRIDLGGGVTLTIARR